MKFKVQKRKVCISRGDLLAPSRLWEKYHTARRCYDTILHTCLCRSWLIFYTEFLFSQLHVFQSQHIRKETCLAQHVCRLRSQRSRDNCLEQNSESVPHSDCIYQIWPFQFLRANKTDRRVLRGILGPRGDGVIRDWRRLHNEELHNLYQNDKIKESETGTTCSTTAEKRNTYRTKRTQQDQDLCVWILINGSYRDRVRGGVVRIGLIWLRIGANEGLSWTQQWSSGSH
jgi:hypothetical protein